MHMLLTPLLYRLLSFKASPQRTRLLGAALSTIFVIVMVIHMVMDEFLLHATSFGLGVYLLATYSLKTIQQIADPQIKATLRSMALFGCNAKHFVGLPIAFLLELHGWWHVFTAFGGYIAVVVVDKITANDVSGNPLEGLAWPIPLAMSFVMPDITEISTFLRLQVMEESKVDYSLRLQEAAPSSIDHDSPTEPTSNINGQESIETTKPTYDASPVLLSFIWFGMFLLAIAVSLAGQTIVSYQPYALSEFNAHSMLSVIGTIQYILYAIVKPALARAANVWGLLEAFSLSIAAILIGFAINAASQNLGGLAAGQIFYTIGQVGIQFLQQILVAEITTLENRSILGSLILSPTIFTSWIGAPIVSAMVPAKWRCARASTVQILFGQLVSGAGTGMISIIAQTAVQAVTPRQDVASVTTLYEVAGAIGGAVGNAISGIVWTALLLSRLRANLPATAQSAAVEIQNSFLVASSYLPGSPERIAIDKSYTEVMHVLLIVALAVLSFPFIAMFAMENIRLKEETPEQE
nr:hypothetical protein [Trichoderma harzianum]